METAQNIVGEAKIILTIVLSIFPLLGLLIILTKHTMMGRYTVGILGPLSLDKISVLGALILGIALAVFGIAAIAGIWLFL